MSRLLILSITGGSRIPVRKLVSVEDPIRYLGILRAKLVKEQIDYMAQNYIPSLEADNEQADFLRTLKVKLYDTGLSEYPETDAEVEALYKKFDKSNK